MITFLIGLGLGFSLAVGLCRNAAAKAIADHEEHRHVP